MNVLKNLISLDRTCSVPLYLQIVNGVVQQIQNGILRPGVKLPGSRTLAQLFEVHRKTIVRSLEELDALGWIEILPNKGSFITEKLPNIKPRLLESESFFKNEKEKFEGIFKSFPNLKEPFYVKNNLAFDDGFPDPRLAPIEDLARAYAKQMRKSTKNGLSYGDPKGSLWLRKVLADELSRTRGLNISEDHIMITRGSQAGIFLAAMSTLNRGDKIIVGKTNYFTANLTFEHLGAEILTIPVDENGLRVEDIEHICKTHKIKAVFVTSHHHHPTTVTLIPERRIKLLALAEQYQFAILEDDYDYDFHYSNSPILPLASADKHGLVLYVGSFSKTIAPAFRVGYLVGPLKLIHELIKLRRLFDRQGDIFLENALADLIERGIIRRHLKKALRHYRERRDYCCELLQAQFGHLIEFKIPSGGMAIWAKFDEEIDLKKVRKLALKEGLYLTDHTSYFQNTAIQNAMRIGFASMNLDELKRAVEILRRTVDQAVSQKLL
ncbi:MAG: PLP-dependent aminotransferase family protein [Bacteroidetes bacterium]|jgi:GntR family transcriptional regulator/MocR family aminotransferase|nr:PLP-dependent aminotransferase family protein [Bacteroidota bacterium]MDF1864976.1 PLP-dependent aminotransferase family protein [Saprospiraceae bacterium]